MFSSISYIHVSSPNSICLEVCKTLTRLGRGRCHHQTVDGTSRPKLAKAAAAPPRSPPSSIQAKGLDHYASLEGRRPYPLAIFATNTVIYTIFVAVANALILTKL
jgi:hypothetical protein